MTPAWSAGDGATAEGSGTETTANVGDSPGRWGTTSTVDLGTGLTAVSKVAVGFGTVCAILDDGDETTPSLKCWGKGDERRPGLGDAVTRGDGQYEMGNYLRASIWGYPLPCRRPSRGRRIRLRHPQQQPGQVLGDGDGRSDRAREERCDGGRIRRDGG